MYDVGQMRLKAVFCDGSRQWIRRCCSMSAFHALRGNRQGSYDYCLRGEGGVGEARSMISVLNAQHHVVNTRNAELTYEMQSAVYRTY